MMTSLRTLLSRLRGTFAGRRSEIELNAQIEAHLDALADDYVRRGVSPGEARAAARRDFGGIEQMKEACRDLRGIALINSIGRDVQYAVRTIARNPAFAVAAVITLALGIGANTAVFSLLDAVTLRSLPVRDPEHLLQVVKVEGTVRRGENYSYPQVRALSEQRDVFSGVFGAGSSPVITGAPDALQRADAAWVTGDYYETLGVHPVAGRLLSARDDQPGAPPAAVITEEYWNRLFSRDPAAIGRTIPIEGVPVPIVGITPRGFGGVHVGQIADITLAVSARPQLSPRDALYLGPGANWLRLFVRLQPDVMEAQAGTRLAVVWTQLATSRRPAGPALVSPRLAQFTLALVSGRTGSSPLREQFGPPLYALMVIVAVVLLIACANVANLLLARAAARQREIAVRLALGAARSRIVRQVLIEGMVLSSAGTILGVGLAWGGSDALIDLLSTGRMEPVLLDVRPNGHVLLFATLSAMATALCFGLAPALRASSTPCASLLNQSSSRIFGSPGRLASTLVVCQVALSLVLLTGAGLFVETLHNLRTLDAGFRHEGVLLARVDAARAGYSGADTVRLYDELLERARQIPGVRSASFSIITPPSGGGGISLSVGVNGHAPRQEEFHINGVSPGYFQTMSTPIVMGREFTSGDNEAAPKVAIINEAFAARELDGVSPIGQRVSLGSPPGTRGEMSIVGVVRDAVYETLRSGAPPTVYIPFAQSQGGNVTFEISADRGLAQVSSVVRSEFQRRLPRTIVDVRTLTSQVEATLVQDRLMATLGAGFGTLGLLLAAIGLYGLLAYVQSTRAKEIGVRIALGAGRARVMWTVVRDALALLTTGAACGLPIVWAVSRLVGSLLFGVRPFDPTTIITATAVLVAAGTLAGFLPAYRSASVDPMIALRHE